MSRRRAGFFQQESSLADEQARQRDVEALIAPRRTVTQDLPLARIRPNPFQARRTFDGLEELADAIRAHGFVSRLRVRPDPIEPNYFQLVYGERRLRAAALAGVAAVPCDIAEHSDDELLEIGLAENIQRRDLDPLEEAQAFQAFIDGRGYSIRRLAERIGKDKSYVEDRLALLRMPADVREMVAQRPDSLRSAREIAKVDLAEERLPLISGVVQGALSTSDVREAVRDLTAPRSSATPLGAAGERQAPDPLGALRRSVARDLQAARAILARWEHLIVQGEAERAVVAPAADALVADLERVAQLLNTPPSE